MSRLKLSKTKQIENLILAAMLWNEESPRKVRLDRWVCGTHACFGGRLAMSPEFQAKGVEPGGDGQPLLFNKKRELIATGAGVAQELFGDPWMFSSRDPHVDGTVAHETTKDYRRYKVSDHKLVARRLEKQFEALTS